MHKGRLEAFSDGVIAIIITIMVLELKVPHNQDLNALGPLIPTFVCYLISFIYVGIYWNNHHHLFQASQKVSGAVLWANLHLLFWLSLIPFATAWMGENQFGQWPVVLYGANLLLCGVAYYMLSQTLILLHGKRSALATSIGTDFKGKISVVMYAVGITLAFYNATFSYAVYIAVAIMWLVPDRRIENVLAKE